MLWIGLTGGLASGKSTASDIFKKMGTPVVDADRLSHQALRVKKDSILERFGPDILNSKGEIDRSLLGKRVFSNQKSRKFLESLIHPYVQGEVKENKDLLMSLGYKMAVYDIPLLFENHLENHFDHILVVYIPESLSLERLMVRDGLEQGEAIQRIKTQMDIEEKKKRADTLIDNQGDKEALENKIKHFLCDFLKKDI